MHEYIIGKTGVGKSTLLEHHALGNEGGFAFLDPHGDSAMKLADTIDCIFWEPSDTEHVIGFNPLKNIPSGQRHLVAAQVVSSFKAIWGESWGPRLEWILYNSLRLLLDNNATLLDIPLVLTDSSYRTRCLRRASFKKFWENEFEAWDDRYRNEAIAPVLNKVGQLTANPVLAGILAHGTINISRVMDRGQRLVVNLSKGKLGEEPSHLLGALLVSAFAQAAEARANIPFEERRPFTLYVDEFQNFATDSFARILSEARKYRLDLVLAHQFLGQVPDLLRQAVFGNVGRFVSFKVGSEDAPLIARELGLHNPEILTDLERFEAWERVGMQPNNFKSDAPIGAKERISAVRRRTHSRYVRAA
jgi:hypothetical protein